MRHSRLLNLLIAICTLCLSTISEALSLGVGLSSVTSGRYHPALTFAANVTNKYRVSGFIVGMRTKIYYENGYSLNALREESFGKLFLGEFKSGIGLGGYYGRRGVLVVKDGTSNEEIGQDFGAGPAFRVALHPISSAYISLEFMMGICSGIFGMGFCDVGIMSVGVDF